MSTAYNIHFHGAVEREHEIKTSVLSALNELGVSSEFVEFFAEAEWADRDLRAPSVILYFGGETHQPLGSATSEAIEHSFVVIPIVSTLDEFTIRVPPELHHINGFALPNGASINPLISLILESLSLLRKTRKLFISYKRSESTDIAMQLYEAFDSRGFRPFLDSRSVRPAVDFQEELFHEFSDSDLIVVLDTPDFWESYWTRLEIEQAYEMNVELLHVLWPDKTPTPKNSLSNFYFLGSKDFQKKWCFPSKQTLASDTVTKLCDFAESLRARAMAARQRYLVDSFCDISRDLGFEALVQPERYVAWDDGKKKLAVFPAVGIPDALTVEDVAEALDDVGAVEGRLLFDERGLSERWRRHLTWLNSHLPIKCIEASRLEEKMKGGSI